MEGKTYCRIQHGWDSVASQTQIQRSLMS